MTIRMKRRPNVRNLVRVLFSVTCLHPFNRSFGDFETLFGIHLWGNRAQDDALDHTAIQRSTWKQNRNEMTRRHARTLNEAGAGGETEKWIRGVYRSRSKGSGAKVLDEIGMVSLTCLFLTFPQVGDNNVSMLHRSSGWGKKACGKLSGIEIWFREAISPAARPRMWVLIWFGYTERKRQIQASGDIFKLDFLTRITPIANRFDGDGWRLHKRASASKLARSERAGHAPALRSNNRTSGDFKPSFGPDAPKREKKARESSLSGEEGPTWPFDETMMAVGCASRAWLRVRRASPGEYHQRYEAGSGNAGRNSDDAPGEHSKMNTAK
ncbi:hypothetical protein BC827DRAFT_1155924 [Russula dissimulans]|nr:hypothetical protein BC827DRAFT_1155924 [Russula dissimulans]